MVVLDSLLLTRNKTDSIENNKSNYSKKRKKQHHCPNEKKDEQQSIQSLHKNLKTVPT